MPNDLFDTIRNNGFHDGYHQCIEDTISSIAVRLMEPTGVSRGTRAILTGLVSEFRMLQLRNVRTEENIG